MNPEFKAGMTKTVRVEIDTDRTIGFMGEALRVYATPSMVRDVEIACKDYLGEYLGLGRKLDTDFQLWLDCMAGDPAALRKMSRYNRQDVVLLESVFDALLPYVRHLPRLVEATEIGQSGCPSCGSKRLVRAGHYRNITGNEATALGLVTAGKPASLERALLKGAWAFVRTYLLRAGFLDGRRGLMLAISNAEGTYYRVAKAWLAAQDKPR